MGQITAGQIVAAVAVLTLVGTVIVTVAGWLLHAKDKAQELEMKRISDSLESAWKKIDELREDRHRYLTHDNGEKLRAELRADLAELGTRLIKEIEKVSNQFREDVKLFMKESA